ncbi:hypothetical protein [Jiangella alkaliphila]|uniref:Uncharacterized protein n=1 Tax=Jiangella alkaliphila TaxID=419479 RepID=A0A1H2JEH2_9ACTN|nr:hypothetical protein [Jiangella alkaliphila]SDU54779.1 hypothetical protein SAMN04488563_2607 [Jiangella alkaliphila]
MCRVAAPLGLLLLTGCGDDGDSDGSAPTGAPPGSPITADLTVPRGAVLLGGPFPHEGGTEALLLVDGDPVAAFADLVDQVRAAGLEPLTYHPDDDAEPSACLVADVEYPEATGERWPLGSDDVPSGDDPLALECETHAFGPDGYRLDVKLLVSERADPYLSFVRIAEVEDSPSSPLPDLETEAPTPEGDSPVTPPPVPDDLPGPGDPIGAPFAPSGEEHLLLNGYELLAPPVLPACATGGFVAVVRGTEGQRTGDAVSAWVEQLGLESFAEVPAVDSDVTTTHDGVQSRRVVLSGPGAGTVTVTGAGEYVLLDRCND